MESGEHFFQPKRNRNSLPPPQLFLHSCSVAPSQFARSRGVHAFGKRAQSPTAGSGDRGLPAPGGARISRCHLVPMISQLCSRHCGTFHSGGWRRGTACKGDAKPRKYQNYSSKSRAFLLGRSSRGSQGPAFPCKPSKETTA